MQQLQQQKQFLQQWQHRLQLAMQQLLQARRRKLEHYATSLQQLNPHQVLARGYAIVQQHNGYAVTDASQLEAGEHLQLTLHRGEAQVVVTNVMPDKK
jgi:exodeoxyribonuclease VII large subunit